MARIIEPEVRDNRLLDAEVAQSGPRPFDRDAPTHAGYAGELDIFQQVEEWANTGGEDFMDAAHRLRVCDLQHGIQVAEHAVRLHLNAAENARELADRLRSVAKGIAHVGMVGEVGEVKESPYREGGVPYDGQRL